jgi:flagellar protein FliO/FliZ
MAFALVFFVAQALCAHALYAQAAEAQADGAQNQIIDEGQVLLGESPASGDSSDGGPSSVFLLIRVIFVLAIVCALVYGVLWMLKKGTRLSAAKDPYLKAVSSVPLTPSASVHVVTVGSQAFVLGVTDRAVSLIGEVSDAELVDAMNLEADKRSIEPVGSFSNVLAKFFPSPAKANVERARDAPDSAPERGAAGASSMAESQGGEESAILTADFIQRQRERLSRKNLEGEGDR